MLQISEKFRQFVLPASHEAVRSLSGVRPMIGQFAGRIIAPYNVENTITLQDYFEVDPPVRRFYDYCGGSPFQVQRLTCEFLTMNRRAYVLNGTGTGKTRATVWAFDALQKEGCATRALIVAPLSTLVNTWAKDIEAAAPGLKVAVLHGTKRQRLKRLSEDADIYLINHDGEKVIHSALMQRVESGDITHIVLDELTSAYRCSGLTANGGNGNAKVSERYRLMRELTARCKWVWGLTAEPLPNGPLDCWAQMMIVTPDTCPRFAEFRDATMWFDDTRKRWVRKANWKDETFKLLQPAVRFSLDDIVELPPRRIVKRRIALTIDQTAAMKTLKAKGWGAANKRNQISLGWMYDNSGVKVFDNAPRIAAMLEEIANSEKKTIVFASYRHAVKGLSAILTAKGISHAVINGETSARRRNEIFSQFQGTSEPRVLIAQPRAISHGVTLTAASTIVWFGPVASTETYLQANARIRRIGQDTTQKIVWVYTDREEQKFERHEERAASQLTLLRDYEREGSRAMVRDLKRAA